MLATQLQTLLQSVSLPFSEIEEMDKQVTAWENESISEKGSVVQNLKEKIRANEEKLNKLVSVFLDGDIPRDMYLQRKDLLMREKVRLRHRPHAAGCGPRAPSQRAARWP